MFKNFLLFLAKTKKQLTKIRKPISNNIYQLSLHCDPLRLYSEIKKRNYY